MCSSIGFHVKTRYVLLDEFLWTWFTHSYMLAKKTAYLFDTDFNCFALWVLWIRLFPFFTTATFYDTRSVWFDHRRHCFYKSTSSGSAQLSRIYKVFIFKPFQHAVKTFARITDVPRKKIVWLFHLAVYQSVFHPRNLSKRLTPTTMAMWFKKATK